jgi:hypothetical protein
LQETDVDVIVLLNPVEQTAASHTDERGWPAGYFEDTYGACRDEPLERLPQGQPETREALR